jgi:hypothetical protein
MRWPSYSQTRVPFLTGRKVKQPAAWMEEERTMSPGNNMLS